MADTSINLTVVLASAVTALATVGLVVFAIIHWRISNVAIQEASKTRSAQVLLDIYDILADLRSKWHELYALPRAVSSWSQQDRELADEVGTQLQRIAFLCMKDLVDAEFIMESYGKVFVKCWDRLRSYTREYRKQSGEPDTVAFGGYQRRHLEMFAWRCEQYLKQESITHGLPNTRLHSEERKRTE